MRVAFLCSKCYNFEMSQDWNELHLKRWFFLPKSASSVSRLQANLAKRERVERSIGFNFGINRTLYGMIPRFLCKIRLNDVSEMFSCLEQRWIDVDSASHTLSTTALIFSGVRTVFGFSSFGLAMRMPLSFTFSQDNGNTELSVLRFFQNPYAIVAHILQQ